jgi:DNA invertase Pin-like site-specific DNA recombinase
VSVRIKSYIAFEDVVNGFTFRIETTVVHVAVIMSELYGRGEVQMKIGYARVSTKKQLLDSQLDELKVFGCDYVYAEKASGTDDTRPQLLELITKLNGDDTLVVYKLDRLSRSAKTLCSIFDTLTVNGIKLISVTEGEFIGRGIGRMAFELLADRIEEERDAIVERTKSGLAAARARGRNGGRPKTDTKIVAKALKLYDGGDHPVSAITDLTGVTKATLYRELRLRDKILA